MSDEAAQRDSKHSIVHITLDERSVVRRSPDVEHERAVAIYDLLEENSFAPAGEFDGPFHLHLGIEENRLRHFLEAEAQYPVGHGFYTRLIDGRLGLDTVERFRVPNDARL